MPVNRGSHQSVPRDLFGAVALYLDAEGRRCTKRCGSTPEGDGHQSDPPCEAFARDVLRQRFAEQKPVPGMSEDAALWGVTERTFDDLARVVEVSDRGEPITCARFTDLPDSMQRSLTSGLRGAFMQMATMARNKAPR